MKLSKLKYRFWLGALFGITYVVLYTVLVAVVGNSIPEDAGMVLIWPAAPGIMLGGLLMRPFLGYEISIWSLIGLFALAAALNGVLYGLFVQLIGRVFDQLRKSPDKVKAS
jgi:hypothetical protein